MSNDHLLEKRPPRTQQTFLFLLLFTEDHRARDNCYYSSFDHLPPPTLGCSLFSKLYLFACQNKQQNTSFSATASCWSKKRVREPSSSMKSRSIFHFGKQELQPRAAHTMSAHPPRRWTSSSTRSCAPEPTQQHAGVGRNSE